MPAPKFEALPDTPAVNGLNPALLPRFQSGEVFRIYASALTQLNLDRHNRISTTDTRLVRRIVRDAFERGYSARETIQRWESVQHGEKRNIFPYQENADLMFNSALVYELAALKPLAEPLLRQVLDSTGRAALSDGELAAALERKGHEVHVFTRMGPGQGMYDRIDGVHYHRCPFRLNPDFVEEAEDMCRSFVHRLFQIEDFVGPFDVVHAQELELKGRTDQEQLAWAASEERALFSFNVKVNFCFFSHSLIKL